MVPKNKVLPGGKIIWLYAAPISQTPTFYSIVYSQKSNLQASKYGTCIYMYYDALIC